MSKPEHDPASSAWLDVDIVVLGCWPKRMMPTEPYFGCITDVCRTCGGNVWVGPRQAAVRAAHVEAGREVDVVCLPCVARLQNAREENGLGVGDVHEVLSLGNEATPAGIAATDQAMAAMRRKEDADDPATE